ncbi:bifunctional folylpolyglutamate synthase/dihydrofolate synthase [Chryseosolibacter indicus]|uniref:Dihydrofolate synthase/folylpolyglutamate synthase n=1 Tax=Chryseosolibacter indicus TaxID=2782351 RepID=A0ABS5VPV8_9BACT|nr:folylpolyglutamate synthase/dihydrofolate synthase family protein [Chryseosolibacter indicus]MBT1703467.1 bifunctional folylpolyglutamate synthase/dihydrofolate synthase [Chryseosolibacter indicus]
MLHTYQEAVKYLYENLPMFQRVGAIAFKKDLTNTLKLCAFLGNPQTKFKSIHIAGTNGKGSTSHMLASVLQSAGYKTGLYTSPHLKDFTERIRINGIEVSQDYVVDFVNRIHEAIAEIKPSFFEITVAMAFDYFAMEKIDVAVIEVGLGGRLDSTNVITPVVSVITNIGWDHKDLLGDTLEKIAFEKAGIIKKEVPVVVSERQAEVQDVFIRVAHDAHASIVFASDRYTVKQQQDGASKIYAVYETGSGKLLRTLKIPLLGFYQQKNITGVLQAVDVINDLDFKINEQSLVQGLENVTSQTGLKGRWQILNNKPLMVCDTGHNIDGVREVVNQINQLQVGEKHIVFGVVKDKDVSEILNILPKEAHYYFCQAQIPRAMEAETLSRSAQAFGLQGEVVPDVNEAISKALSKAKSDDLVFIGGSTFVVAEIKDL